MRSPIENYGLQNKVGLNLQNFTKDPVDVLARLFSRESLC